MDFIVGCDFDGTLNDMHKFNIEEGEKMFGRKPTNPDAYSTEKMYEFTKGEKVTKALALLIKYCKSCPLRENAKNVLDKLSRENNKIHLISARMFVTSETPFGAYWRKLVEDFVEKHKLPFETIQYCSESNTPRDKYMACMKLNVDVMIDDKPDVCLYLAERGIKVIMVKTPYNRDVKHENIIPVDDWDEVYEQVNILKEMKKETPRYIKATIEEQKNMDENKRVTYLKSYKNFIHMKYINKDFANLEQEFMLDEQVRERKRKKYKLMYNLLRIPFKIMFGAKIHGKENIPYQGGFIIACNHLDYRDQFFVVNALKDRLFYGMAAQSVKDTMRGRLFNLVGNAIYIARDNNKNDYEALEKEMKNKNEDINQLAQRSREIGTETFEMLIDNGEIAIIFPEGSRKNKTEEGKNQLQMKFKFGTVSMAQKLGCPILPVSLFHGKNGKSTIRFGELQFVTREESLDDANKKLESTILNMTLESMNELNNKNSKVK